MSRPRPCGRPPTSYGLTDGLRAMTTGQRLRFFLRYLALWGRGRRRNPKRREKSS